MWAAIRSIFAVFAITATVATAQAGLSAAAVIPSDGFLVTAVLPSGGQVVGIAHPVVVTFGAPVANRRAAERALQVTSTPPMTGTYEWTDANVVQWIPDRFWPAHSAVAFSAGGLAADFKTGPAVIGVADISYHTFTVSIDGVEAGTSPRLPAPHHRPHYGEEGVLPASMGKEKFPTPVGTYRVMAKDRSVTMDSSSVGIRQDDPEGYLLSVDHAVRISSRGLYVHSAPWALNSLGVANVSHGCISLSPADAEWYFNTVNIGDPVIVREGPPHGPAPAVR